MRVLLLVMLLCCSTDAFAQSASTWFLAEGASNAIFDEDILVGNPSGAALTVSVQLLPGSDAIFTGPNPVTFTLPATGRLTVNLKQSFPGLNGAASARVSAVIKGTDTPADIIVERSLFFPQDAVPYGGGSSASGTTAPATRWVLAEGSGGIFQTFILLANPGTTPVTADVTYLRSNGSTITVNRAIPPGGRETLWPTSEEPLASEGFSTVVEATGPIVAERAMYFDSLKSGHDELGIAEPKSTWYFAEGFTGGNPSIAFETFILIGNDADTPAQVTATYYLDAGTPITKTYTVGKKSRFNIWTDAERDGEDGPLLLPGVSFSVKLESTIPIVAERAVYWGTPSATDPTRPVFPWKEGHAVAGIEAPQTTWAFAEGRQGGDPSGATFDSFFLLVNPNASPIQVRATFVTEDGRGVVVTVPVAANTRTNIWPVVQGGTADPDYALLNGRRFAAFLESVGDSPLPFVAERAMYWNDFTGGHANGGTPWTGAITAPANKPVAVSLTSMAPTSGRLSGGTSVTITGSGFGGTTEVYFAGQRVLPSSVTSTEITFTTPARTQAGGYGNAGPVPVAVLTNGRYMNAPNFTRYFSILAFGDSITWGVTNKIVAGQKVDLHVDRPYPLVLRNGLRAVPQYGQYVLVTNAGWPGEAIVPDGETRAARCTAGLPNCFYAEPPPNGAQPRPADYLAPHDVIVVLEGVNDLNDGRTPERVRDSLRVVTQDAKAKGLRVLLTRFDSYGINEATGEPAVDLWAAEQLGNLTYLLAEEQQVQRERFVLIDMCPDGLHPTQWGYDRMGEIIATKLIANFPK